MTDAGAAPVIRRVIVAPDKFKGTLSAHEAARAIARGVERAWPGAVTERVPLSDGGEGFVEVVATMAGADIGFLDVTGPSGGRAETPIASLAGRCVVETVRGGPPNPLGAHTAGTGEAIATALRRCGSVIVGVGGSGSTDGGTGAARAIGWRFLDDAGDEIPLGGRGLSVLAAIDGSRSSPIPSDSVVAACDVDNGLLGPEGAARVYGPQKGASPGEVAVLEKGLERLAERVSIDLGSDIAGRARSGAGGGLGYGLAAFFGAELRSGAGFTLEAAGLEHRIAGADLVITGEGSLDAQSLRGKLTAEVGRLAGRYSVPSLAFAGRVRSRSAVSGGPFQEVVAVSDVVGTQRAMTDPEASLELAVVTHLPRFRRALGGYC